MVVNNPAKKINVKCLKTHPIETDSDTVNWSELAMKYVSEGKYTCR